MNPEAKALNTSGPELRCPKCSGTDLRRTMPRNRRERFLRTVLPMHLYFCRSCEQRSWIWGAVPQGLAHGQAAGPSGGRTLEPRDRALARRNRGRMLRSALVAVLLGGVFGLYLKSCQDRRVDRSTEVDRTP
jgi:hypothetical protein